MSEIMESEIVYIRSNQSILKSTPNLFTALACAPVRTQ